MGLPRSTYYAAPEGRPSDLETVAQIRAITDEFESYGYRRVDAELRHRGHIVNAKKVRRLMREHDLNPRRRRRFTRTTDSDHDRPIHPFVARDFEIHGPDQLWVADLTYVAIATGFVYVAIILDAWSRRVVGYAIGRSLDARHAVAALERAVALRRPLPGCVVHTDRGSQYASEKHRALLAAHGLVGSMSRRGNPYDNAKAESFMKTLKVEAVYLAEYETYPLGALVVGSGRPRSTLGPAAGDGVLLPDAGFILPPQLYLGSGREPLADLVQFGRKVFLKASIASSFCAKWRGRAEILRYPSARNSRPTVVSLSEMPNSSQIHCARSASRHRTTS